MTTYVAPGNPLNHQTSPTLLPESTCQAQTDNPGDKTMTEWQTHDTTTAALQQQIHRKSLFISIHGQRERLEAP